MLLFAMEALGLRFGSVQRNAVVPQHGKEGPQKTCDCKSLKQACRPSVTPITGAADASPHSPRSCCHFGLPREPPAAPTRVPAAARAVGRRLCLPTSPLRRLHHLHTTRSDPARRWVLAAPLPASSASALEMLSPLVQLELNEDQSTQIDAAYMAYCFSRFVVIFQHISTWSPRKLMFFNLQNLPPVPCHLHKGGK